MESEFKSGFKRFKAEQARIEKAERRKSVDVEEAGKPLNVAKTKLVKNLERS